MSGGVVIHMTKVVKLVLPDMTLYSYSQLLCLEAEMSQSWLRLLAYFLVDRLKPIHKTDPQMVSPQGKYNFTKVLFVLIF